MSLSDLTLDPAVSIDATFLVDSIPLTWIEPSVGLFLAPELVGILEQLGPIVGGAIRTMSAAASVRGQIFPKDQATTHLEWLVESWLAARPESAQWVGATRDAAGRLRLKARSEGLDRFVAPDHVAIRLRFAKAGQRTQCQIPLSSARALAVIMDVLRGDFPPGVDLALADRDVRGAIAALESIGGLIPRAAAGDPFVPDGHDATVLTVTHMGHAFLIADGGSRRVLFDPVLHAWRDEYAVQPLTARQFGPVDAIFFTQHHLDHMDLASLLMLPHRVPVFVPGGADQPLTPRCADYLRTLGFVDVREINAGDVATVGDLQVHALTFTGKGRDVLGFGANVYIACLGSQRVLIHADASPDNSGRSMVSSGELARWIAGAGPIRAIYGTWQQERTFLCALSPLTLVKPEVTADRWLADVEYRKLLARVPREPDPDVPRAPVPHLCGRPARGLPAAATEVGRHGDARAAVAVARGGLRRDQPADGDGDTGRAAVPAD